MAFWRYILHGMIIFAFAACLESAQKDVWAASYSNKQIAGEANNISNGSPLFFANSNHDVYRLSDMEQMAGTGNIIREAPGVCFNNVATAALADRDLEKSLINDEDLGSVSGGAVLFATPEVVNRRLFAIILWDEVKSKRSATFDQGHVEVSSKISVLGR